MCVLVVVMCDVMVDLCVLVMIFIGFFGSGKMMLLNYVLKVEYGK